MRLRAGSWIAVLLLTLLGCDRGKEGTSSIQGPERDPAILTVRVIFPDSASAKVAAILGVEKVTALVHTQDGQLLKHQDLNVSGSRFWGRIEIEAGDSLALSLAFIGGDLLRWFGRTDGIDVEPGQEKQITVRPVQLLRTLRVPASVDADSGYVISWATYPHADGYELQEAHAADFSDGSTLYAGTDTLFLRTGGMGNVSRAYRVRVLHSLGYGPWSAAVEVQVHNRPPVAVAGEDQVVAIGSTVSLDASMSYDPDGGALSFEWAPPLGLALSSSSEAQPEFVADQIGTFIVVLSVRDDALAIGSDSVRVTVYRPNRVPVADAGPDQGVTQGALVTLDGSGSRDPDGGDLKFRWTAPVGVALDDASSIQPQFAAADSGVFSFELVVEDDSLASARDEVVVTVELPNRVPVAEAGPPQAVEAGELLTLDGTESHDPDGESLSYLWTAPPGVGWVTLTDQQPEFVVPSPGVYDIVLVVSDGRESSSPDTVVITVTQANRLPDAVAGPDQTVLVGGVVRLDGGGSQDADDDSLGYSWTVPSGVTLSGSRSPTPTFTASVAGTYIFVLVVNDGQADSPPDEVVITVVDSNRPPTANAGPDQTVSAGEWVTLDASGSSDADNDPLAYTWTAPPGIGWESRTDQQPRFVPTVPGTYQITLVVNDGQVDSTPDETKITVLETPEPTTGDVQVIGEIEEDTGDVQVIGEIDEDTGDVQVIGEVEEDTGDVQVIGEIEEDTGDAEVIGEIDE